MSQRKRRFIILCLLPFSAYLVFFTWWPIFRVFYLSLCKNDTCSLVFFRSLLSEKAFQKAFWNTLIIAGGSLSIELIAGLIIALLLSSNRFSASGWAQLLFLIPLAVPTVVAGVAMSFLFSSSGWINYLLQSIGLIKTPIFWMEGGWKSLFMVMLADSWKVTPLVILILLAGLEGIDRNLYRAAAIDGAGIFFSFKRITLPLLLPSITTAVIIRGIDAFRLFSLPLILMGQNMQVIGTFAYAEYMNFGNIHLSAASSVCLFFLILLMILLYIKCIGKKGWAT